MTDEGTVATVRPLVEADLSAVYAIYSDAVSTGIASWEFTPPTLGEMRRRITAVVDAGYPFLVAEVSGTVAGYAYASSYRSRPGYQFTVENSVYTSAAHRRLGVGRMLLTELIDRCSELGYRQMIAVIGSERNPDGDSPSVSLHRSLGFEPVARLPAIGFKFGRWLDSVVMQLALGHGSETQPSDFNETR